MIEICLLIIAITSVIGAVTSIICSVTNVSTLEHTKKVFEKQVLQLSDDVRFQRNIAQKNFLDAEHWKELALANQAKANGSAFEEFVRNLRNEHNKIEDKNSERAKATAGLLTMMEKFSAACNKVVE